jgi:2-amino-4-hydroxy-6-hydroxymethyldihydropteridine diphosphokinase
VSDFNDTDRSRIILLIGGNLGDRELLLKRCRNLIELLMGQIIRSSSIYQTQAWGIEEQAAFLNQAIEIQSPYSPLGLLQQISAIEQRLGRVRTKKWAARHMDIDILVYGEQVINTEVLQVPHPEIQNRRFALLPLCEIAGDMIHPVFGLEFSEILDNCKDKLEVSLFDLDNRK